MLSELDAGGNVCGLPDDETYKGLVGVANDFITSCRTRFQHHPHHHPTT